MNPLTPDTIAVIGAGTMGTGIAQVALVAGLRVILCDSSDQALTNACGQLDSRLARLVEKAQLTAQERAAARSRLILSQDLAAVAPAQVVIEAIIEQLEPKLRLFTALEAVVAPGAILASNTSSLSVASIARACEHRQRVCGMHFFNPVPLMDLVEIVRAPDTSEDTVARAFALAERLRKTPISVQDVPGFLVNLLGRAFSTEALHIQHEGVAPVEVIDLIMRSAAGFRMGPFELMDLTGIDVNLPATRYIYEGFQQDPRLKTTLLHESLFRAGRYGRKSGQGFHQYTAGKSDRDATSEPGDDRTAPGPLSCSVAEDAPGFERLRMDGLVLGNASDADALLVSPAGEDAASMAARLRLDAARVVAVDFFGLERKFITLMSPIGAAGCAQKVATMLRGLGYSVAVIRDSPGFVAPRIISMMVNLACEVAQAGIGAPGDMDVAMRLAQNYPRGPFEWGEWLGPERVFRILSELQQITGSDRYRPSLWLRRRALLGLPIRTRD